MTIASPIDFILLTQVADRAFSRAVANTGNRIAAKIVMIAITIKSSIRVNPDRRTVLLDVAVFIVFPLLQWGVPSLILCRAYQNKGQFFATGN
jgi:hypothetical protein